MLMVSCRRTILHAKIFAMFFNIFICILQDIIASDVVNPDHIDVEFDSIGGLDNVKQTLFELVILPLKRPELFSRGKLLAPQKGVLLYGPPGTGKTMIAKATEKESGAVFINVRVSNLMSKWFGDAQKLGDHFDNFLDSPFLLNFFFVVLEMCSKVPLSICPLLFICINMMCCTICSRWIKGEIANPTAIVTHLYAN